MLSLLFEFSLSLTSNEVEEITTWAIFHHKAIDLFVKSCFLKFIVHFSYKFVLQSIINHKLVFKAGKVLIIAAIFYHFDGKEAAIFASKHHLAEGACADDFDELKVFQLCLLILEGFNLFMWRNSIWILAILSLLSPIFWNLDFIKSVL